MATTSFIYPSAIPLINNGIIDFEKDTFRVTLHDSTYVPNLETNTKFTDLTGELSTNYGYTVGGKEITNVRIGFTSPNKTANFKADKVIWDAITANSITAKIAVISLVGTHDGIPNPLLGCIYLNGGGASVSAPCGTQFIIDFDEIDLILDPISLPNKLKIVNIASLPHHHLGTAVKSNDFSAWSAATQLTGGTCTRSTVVTSNDTSTINCPLGGRAFEQLTFTPTIGRRYAISVDVSNFTGVTNKALLYGPQGTTNYITFTGNGRYVYFFTPNETGSQIIRIGSGLDAAATAGQVCSFSISNVMLEDITDYGADVFSSFVERSKMVSNYPANTASSNVVVPTVGAEFGYATKKINMVFCTGDSFANDDNDFPQYMHNNSDYTVFGYGYSGEKLTGLISSNYSANITKYPYNAAVIQGGINDISAGTITIEQMKSSLSAMCVLNDSLGIPTVIVNVSPYATNAITPSKLTLTLAWNKYLKKYSRDNGYKLIDLYALFEDRDIPNRMAQKWINGTYTGNYTFTGDALHPNVAGQALLGEAIIKAIKELEYDINSSLISPTKFKKISDGLKLDIAPKYDIALTGISGSFARGGSMPTTGNRAYDSNGATNLEWDANSGVTTDGMFISVAYEPSTPFDLSDTDRLMFEFSHDGNWMNSRMYIYVSSNSGTVSGASHRFSYQSTKHHPEVALLLRKSDFSNPSGTGVNWGNVKRIEFRLLKHTAADAKERARVKLHRMSFGGKTRPMVLYTHDDNYSGIYDAFKRHQKYGFTPDVFCTDYELSSETNWDPTKCTLAQDKEMAAAGYHFYTHNITHKAFSQKILSYTITANNTVQVVVEPYGAGNVSEIMPSVGDYVVINETPAEMLNGRWVVSAISLGTYDTTNTTITLTVPGVVLSPASFDNISTSTHATLTVEKYDYCGDVKLLRAMIERTGLPTNEKYHAYTYGRNSLENHKQLAKIGVTLARGTYGGGQDEFFADQIFQIKRNVGLGGSSARLMGIPTLTLNDALVTSGNLQAYLDKLVSTGGVLSLYNHVDGDITNTNHDTAMALIASYRDNGSIDVVNMEELEEAIKVRR